MLRQYILNEIWCANNIMHVLHSVHYKTPLLSFDLLTFISIFYINFLASLFVLQVISRSTYAKFYVYVIICHSYCDITEVVIRIRGYIWYSHGFSINEWIDLGNDLQIDRCTILLAPVYNHNMKIMRAQSAQLAPIM